MNDEREIQKVRQANYEKIKPSIGVYFTKEWVDRNILGIETIKIDRLSSASLIDSFVYKGAELPPKPEWRWTLSKDDLEKYGQGFWFTCYIAPNRFNRWLQKLFLGIHWEKNDDR